MRYAGNFLFFNPANEGDRDLPVGLRELVVDAHGVEATVLVLVDPRDPDVESLVETGSAVSEAELKTESRNKML